MTVLEAPGTVSSRDSERLPPPVMARADRVGLSWIAEIVSVNRSVGVWLTVHPW